MSCQLATHKRVKSLYTHVTCDQVFFPVRKAAVEEKRKKRTFFSPLFRRHLSHWEEEEGGKITLCRGFFVP